MSGARGGWQAGFARAGYSRAEIRMITRLLDADGSGAVDAEEFKRSVQVSPRPGGGGRRGL